MTITKTLIDEYFESMIVGEIYWFEQDALLEAQIKLALNKTQLISPADYYLTRTSANRIELTRAKTSQAALTKEWTTELKVIVSEVIPTRTTFLDLLGIFQRRLTVSFAVVIAYLISEGKIYKTGSSSLNSNTQHNQFDIH